MIFIAYLILAVVCFAISLLTSKLIDGQVTRQDFIVLLLISLCPFLQVVFIVAGLWEMLRAVMNSKSDWLLRRLF